MFPFSAKSIRETAECVDRQVPHRLGVLALVKIALLEAAARGEVVDPEGVFHAIEDELQAQTAALEADLDRKTFVHVAHLRSIAANVERRESADDKAQAVMNRSLAQLADRQIDSSFDPRGWFVYTLWGADDIRPLYVGMSGNVLSRLGDHMRNPDRRYKVERVTLISCKSEARARSVESRLIARHQPPLNTVGVR